MLSVERSTIVRASQEECAAFLAEPLNFGKIDRKVKNMKVIERGPDYSVIEIYGIFGGFFPYWMRLRMDRQPDGGLNIYHLIGPLKAFNATFTLEPCPEGTKITHVEAYNFYEILPGLAARLFQPFVSRVVEEELYRLRRFIEEGWDLHLPWD